MNGTGTVTVPQLSVSILPRDRLVGIDVKLFLLSCCLTAPPLHPGNPSLPSWITTRFRFSLPCCLSLGVSLLMSPIRVQVDDGLSIRVLAGMSDGVVTNLSDKSFTGGVLADDELSCNVGLLPRNRRTCRTSSAPRAPNCLLLLLLPVVGLPRSLSVNLPLSFPLSLFCSLMLSTVSLLSLLPSLSIPFPR